MRSSFTRVDDRHDTYMTLLDGAEHTENRSKNIRKRAANP